MTTFPFVKLDGVAKRWNGQLGVEGITLDIPEGSFTALLGPSGCGKSTTLRLLAGLELPDEGKILIDGKDVTTSAASDRNLSMVFQSYALFPHLSVAENVIFGLKVRRVPKKERLEKLHRALEITGLLGLESRKPGELSGGQRQRVALARAIVAGQRLCLMDEPLSNLDAKLRNAVRKDIKKLQRDLGITVVYVTHDQTEAMSMADTVVLMKDGHIQQVGSPEDLYSRPNNTFVAEFVGAPPMALLKSSVLDGFGEDKTIGIRAENALRSTSIFRTKICTSLTLRANGWRGENDVPP
jgi:sn-glycerol 3-phosphate transport system ATP-binding protein